MIKRNTFCYEKHRFVKIKFLTQVSIMTEVIMRVSLCRSVSTYQPTRHHIPEDYNLEAN